MRERESEGLSNHTRYHNIDGSDQRYVVDERERGVGMRLKEEREPVEELRESQLSVYSSPKPLVSSILMREEE